MLCVKLLESMTSTVKITRSNFTWLAYLMLGFYAYMQSSLGPLMPFLREELGLNYTVAGFHFSAFALGMILAGSSTEYLTNYLERKQLFWWGGLGMSLGGLLLTIGQTASVTVLAAFVMGFVGSHLLVMIQALLSDEFEEQRAIALTESNLAASIFAALAPLVIAFGLSINLDWRLALWFGAGVWLIAWLTQRNVAHPTSPKAKNDQRSNGQLPPIFRLYWLIVFIGVAIEWCMVFWVADFLITVGNIAPDFASTLVGIFYASMIIGRLLGSRLTHKLATMRLLLMVVITIAIGFPIFWLSSNLIGTVLGLVIVGIGLSNLFPLGLAAASNIGADNVNRSSARVSQAAGLAILIAPQTLGTLADSWGIFRAYGVLPILLFILLILILVVIRSERSKDR